MNRKRFILWMIILSLVVPQAAYGAAEESHHWGIERMKSWKEKGLLSGYPDGSLRPDEPITRAQFAILLRSIFHYSSAENYSQPIFNDVKADAWYSGDIAAVAAANIIHGYRDGSFKPNQFVTRQDAAVMLDRAFKLHNVEAEGALEDVKDAAQINPYAYSSIQRLYQLGFLRGYSDEAIRPLKALTRAEAITLLDRLSGNIILEPGHYSNEVIRGNVIIHPEGVTLENTTVTGNVYVTAGVSDGEFSMKNVTIQGDLHVNGGGINSIYIDQSSVETVVVNRPEGKVRIVIANGSKINKLIVENDAIIELDKPSYIKLLAFLKGAEGSELHQFGTIEELLNEAGIKAVENSDGPSEAGSGSGSTPTPTPKPTPTEKEWTLVWNDEFDQSGINLDGNGVDLDKWGYQLGTGSQYGLQGWGNNEQQYYRSENIAVEDGLLKITAKSDGFGEMPYTSGRLYSDPTFTKAYGKFEARMKLPAGEGLWPAFWMMPAGSEYGTWAASGEIDIMEARGRLLNEVGGAIHYGKAWPNNKLQADEYHFPEGEDITDFHVYSLEWEPGELRWYVDGHLYQRINNWDSWGENQPAKYAFPAPFDKPFYMILNLAVGGNYDGGREPSEQDLPAEMLVDYVRVYELTGRPYREVIEPSIEVEPITAPYKEAIDGSYVYDSSYQQPITEVTTGAQMLNESYWNFVALDNFGGAGNVTVEELNASRFAKTTITQAGHEMHSLQLIQQVTLGKGRWYKLSFDAKSDANRNMTVKLGGGEGRGWSVYSDNYSIPLSNELQSYERVFQMSAETDKLARLELNMGLSLHPVWIGNVKLEEISAPDPYLEDELKEPLANGNHVYNGSFDLGYIHRLTYWHTETVHGAEAVFAVDPQERALSIDIAQLGQKPADISLRQRGVMLYADNEYELAFDVETELPRSLTVELLDEQGQAYDSQSVAITAGENSYRAHFYVEEVNSSYGQLVIWLGDKAGTVTLDNIVLLRTTNNNTGELELELQFPLKNGDFSNGSTGWSEHVQGRYDGWDQHTAMSVVDGQLHYHVWSAGNQPWDVMLSQADLSMKKGQTYIIAFDGKATQQREIELVLETSNYNRYVSETIELSTEWQRYSYELEMTQDELMSFKLLLGKIGNVQSIGEHQLWIDNVNVEVKGAREGAFLTLNGYFDEGLSRWNHHVQGVYDGPSNAVFSVDSGAMHAAIQHPGMNPWDIVLFQEAAQLKKEATYVVSFTARAAQAKTIEVVVENSSYNRYLSQQIALSEQAQQYSYEFTMPVQDTAQLKFLFGKQAEEAAAIQNVYLDNVHFEQKGAREAIGELAREEHDLGN